VSSTGKSLPELKKVIVGLGEKIVMEDNIQQAFASLFNVNVTAPGTTPTPSPTDNVPGTDTDVKSMILRASELYDKAKESLQAGDWTAYGQYLNELENVLNQLKQNSQ
jgi:uncharacterized membrane protein (UPF0182 family)